MIKRFFFVVLAALAALVVAGAALYASVGKSGLLLLYVKYALHQDYGPTQPTAWQSGPDASGECSPPFAPCVQDCPGSRAWSHSLRRASDRRPAPDLPDPHRRRL